MTISDRRLRLGRVHLYLEPRDAWIGAYVAPDAIYVCPLPFVVVRWTRVPKRAATVVEMAPAAITRGAA